MKRTAFLVRSLTALSLGGLAALSVFGLLLAMLWLPAMPAGAFFRLASLLVAALLAVLAGGAVCGRIAPSAQALWGLSLGLLSGGWGSFYVLGLHWKAFGLALIFAALGSWGGLIGRRWRDRSSRPA